MMMNRLFTVWSNRKARTRLHWWQPTSSILLFLLSVVLVDPCKREEDVTWAGQRSDVDTGHINTRGRCDQVRNHIYIQSILISSVNGVKETLNEKDTFWLLTSWLHRTPLPIQATLKLVRWKNLFYSLIQLNWILRHSWKSNFLI